MSEPPVTDFSGDHVVYFHSSAKMEEIPDDTIDLTVTSPPYGLGVAYAESDDNKNGNSEVAVKSWADYRRYLRGLEAVWREVYRVTRPGGYVIIDVAPTHGKSEYFGHSLMLPIPYDVSNFFRSKLGAEHRWEYVWYAQRARTNSYSMPVAFLGSYPKPIEGQVLREIESVLVFRKVPFTQEQLWYGDRKERRARSVISDADWRKVYSQVWDFPGASKENVDGVEHPAPFPEEIPRRCILGYSCVGDTVLDPFAGTGTTLAVAKTLGRKSIGYEIEPRFRRHIELKLSTGVSPMSEVW